MFLVCYKNKQTTTTTNDHHAMIALHELHAVRSMYVSKIKLYIHLAPISLARIGIYNTNNICM